MSREQPAAASAVCADGRRLGPHAVMALGLLWLLMAVGGLGGLSVYSNGAGPAGAPPTTWPDRTIVTRSGLATLLLFAHPYCPCSRASIGELARLMTAVNGRVSVHVLMYQPPTAPAEWARTSLWTAAAAIPGVQVMADADGQESSRFGVAVSGHTLLYDAEGRLAFSGGITGSRGHEGDNAGRAAIAALLVDGTTTLSATRVFGCFLRQTE